MAKCTPEWTFEIGPRSRIPYRRYEAFAVADILADVIEGRPSSWGGVLTSSAQGNTWSDWARLGDDLTLSNVGFARFAKNGSVTFSAANNKASGGAAGFFAKPIRKPLAVAGSGLGAIATNAEDYAALNQSWQIDAGSFEAVCPLSTTGTSGLRIVGDPATVARARTAASWLPGRGIGGSIALADTGRRNSQGYLRLKVSENLRVLLAQDQPPMLERRALVKSGQVATEAWQVWQTLDEAEAFDARRGYYDWELYVLGNRLVWQWGDKAQWFTDKSSDAQDDLPKGASAPDKVKVADMSKLIGGTPLSVEANNLRARFEFSRRDHTDDEDVLQTGTVARTVTRGSLSGELLQPSGVGNLPPGTSAPVVVTTDGYDVTYTATLTPSEDGSFTPLLTQIYLSYSPVWATPTGSVIDISAAVSRATVSHAHPPAQAGCDASVTIDLKLLQKLVDDGEINSNAVNYLKDYNPIEIKGFWRDEGGTAITSAKNLMRGQMQGIDGNQYAPNSSVLTVGAHGPMMRLRDPFGKVTGKELPLDWWYKRRLAQLELASQEAAKTMFVKQYDGAVETVDPDGTIHTTYGNIIGAKVAPRPGYHGCEAAQDVIHMFLGPAAANALNGNGDARRFLPAGHPPFISYDDMAGSWLALTPTTGHSLSAGSFEAQRGSQLMPPFGEDALSWINKFANDEYCIFTEIFASRDASGYPTDWNVLAYGGREVILSRAHTHTISATDAENLLPLSIAYQTRPDKDFNDIEVWSSPWGSQMPGSPAFVQGRARFAPSHPRSIENTGRRTRVIETSLAATPAQARVLAAIALMESEGTQFVFPTYHLAQGEANLMTGDVFYIEDGGELGSDGVYFRASRVDHEYTRSPDGISWTTNVPLEIMSAWEIRQAVLYSLFPEP